jgi:hypothetical protein
VAGWMIANASCAVDNPRNSPTNINRSMLPQRALFGAARRRTLICWRSAKLPSRVDLQSDVLRGNRAAPKTEIARYFDAST